MGASVSVVTVDMTVTVPPGSVVVPLNVCVTVCVAAVTVTVEVIVSRFSTPTSCERLPKVRARRCLVVVERGVSLT